MPNLARGMQRYRAMDSPAPLSGRPNRLGPYEVIGKLASGGLAVIYLGRRAEPDAPVVALKVARTDLRQNARVARMFMEEATLLPLLDHEGIVRTVDVGVDEGRGYIAMELLLGVPLSAAYESCAKHGIG